MNESTGLLNEKNRKAYIKHLSIDDEDRTSSSSSGSSGHGSASSSYISNHANKHSPSKPLETHVLFTRITVVVACMLLSMPIVIIICAKKITHHHHHHDHTIPSLLGVQKEDGSGYVNALHNPLYEEMLDAEYDKNRDVYANIKSLGNSQFLLDKHRLSFRDNLTVSWDWSGGNPSSQLKMKDHSQMVIALYCPANQPNPRKFLDAAAIPMGIPNNSSSTKSSTRYDWFIPSFPIIREDTCEFRLWSRDTRNLFAPFELLGTSNILYIDNGTKVPATIHLALTENQDEMRVHFSTGVEKQGSKPRVPVVLYSKDEESLKGSDGPSIQKKTGNTTTYKAKDMCQAPASLEEAGKFMSPGLLHSIVMDGLEPYTRYYYKVGVLDLEDDVDETKLTDLDLTNESMGGVIWSEVYNFQSPLRPGTLDKGGNEPISFVVYGDQGVPGFGISDHGGKVSKLVAREIEAHDIRAVHHFGDLGYAMVCYLYGTIELENLIIHYLSRIDFSQGAGHIWDSWLDMTSIFSTSIPLMVGVGNHEYDHTSGGEGKDPSGMKSSSGYMPEWGNFGDDSGGECGVPISKRFVMPSNGNGVFWYSWDYGLVHTIMLSSEHDMSPGSEQYKWLSQNLESVDRAKTPWVIVEAHRPLYMNKNGENDQQEVVLHMRRGIESLLNDHNANIFLGGHYHAYFRSCPGLYKSKCNNGGLTHITIGTAGAGLDTHPQFRRSWVAGSKTEWGYGKITVFNATALYFEFISDADGLMHDSTWIYR